jgi:hypothetical protein
MQKIEIGAIAIFVGGEEIAFSPTDPVSVKT